MPKKIQEKGGLPSCNSNTILHRVHSAPASPPPTPHPHPRGGARARARLFIPDERPGYPDPRNRTRLGRLLFSSVRSPTRRPHRSSAPHLASPLSTLPRFTTSLSPPSTSLARARCLYKERMADAPASPGGGGGSHESGSPRGGGGGGGGGWGVREQDRFLPIANISRIMKKAIPANGKIAKDSKETVQECVSEFISFITSEASDKCQREKRKTINGDDLLWAMATLGFEDYIEPLKVYLQKYREMEGDSKLSAKAGDGSIRKDAVGTHGGASSSSAQGMGQQGAYNQGMGYMQPQYHNGDISN